MKKYFFPSDLFCFKLEKFGMDNMTAILIDLRPQKEGDFSEESDEKTLEEIKAMDEYEQNKIWEKEKNKIKEKNTVDVIKKLDDILKTKKELNKKCLENI